ncbi:MAG: DegT/DnrJ/EryC1/StrS family aminotransferase, partial [Myxococcota bacterium]
GEGGALAARDQLLIARAQRLSNYGFSEGEVVTAGTNAKLSEYHAAVGLAQLDRWSDIVERRKQVWNYYDEMLQEVLGARIVCQTGTPSSAPSMMVVAVPELPAARVLDRLHMRGIQGRRWYCPALHRHAGIREHAELAAAELSTADFLSEHLLGLPFHTRMGKEDVSAVVRKLSAAIEDAAE